LQRRWAGCMMCTRVECPICCSEAKVVADRWTLPGL
jgi:hypothetical protein